MKHRDECNYSPLTSKLSIQGQGLPPSDTASEQNFLPQYTLLVPGLDLPVFCFILFLKVFPFLLFPFFLLWGKKSKHTMFYEENHNVKSPPETCFGCGFSS